MSSDEIQYGVTGDYFDAAPVSDGVAVRMSDNVAEILTNLLHQLLRLLDDGQAERAGRFRRGRSPEAVLRDMFPDAYLDRAEAQGFRDRHAAVLRDTAAVRRVRDRLVRGTTHVIDHTEVDDWIVALGLGRFLYVRRNTRKPGDFDIWINHAQATPVAAVNPETAEPVNLPRALRVARDGQSQAAPVGGDLAEPGVPSRG